MKVLAKLRPQSQHETEAIAARRTPTSRSSDCSHHGQIPGPHPAWRDRAHSRADSSVPRGPNRRVVKRVSWWPVNRVSVSGDVGRESSSKNSSARRRRILSNPLLNIGSHKSSIVQRRFDPHRNLHGDVIRRAPIPCPLQRNCVARVLHDRDADEVLVSRNTRRRIEVDPARTWNVSLDPSVGITTSNLMRVFVLLLGQMHVTRNKPRRNSARAQRRDHQHREVAATAGP